MRVMVIPANIPWKLIGIAASVIAIGAAIWFLVIAPRNQIAEMKVEQAQTDQRRQEVIADALVVLRQAQADIEGERAAAESRVAEQGARRVERDREIRTIIVEQAVAEGDPFVSPGMDAFLRELGRE